MRAKRRLERETLCFDEDNQVEARVFTKEEWLKLKQQIINVIEEAENEKFEEKELSDFEDSEILAHVEDMDLDQYDVKQLDAIVKKNRGQGNMAKTTGTLIDVLKMECIYNNIGKKNLAEIEQFFEQ